MNAKTAIHTITAGEYGMWQVKADSIPPAYAVLDPLPKFHVEWSPVDFDYTGTYSTILEAAPLPMVP